ncbi:MAG: DUF3795 domain-containing protein [Candidatus Helarchaeota archaeon]|nr:DUF3795 domain-containing protein [Candidatus Helarchaeota archaeon]
MSVNPNLLAPCGLYCGVCATYYADKHNNEKMKQKLAKAYFNKPEQIKCDGCLSDNKYLFCQSCSIRRCVKKKELSGCHECSDFPCRKINKFPFELAKKFMLISIPARKERTDEEWVAWEEKNWTCKECGTLAFRGAKRCPNCKIEMPNILQK